MGGGDMKRVKLIFINFVILTASSLVLRLLGLGFQVYLSKKIGPAGIGLIHLIMSVYFLALTFATSGIRLAATRLVAEELGKGNTRGAKRAVRNCLSYSISFSVVVSLILFFSADYIGLAWLEDARTILSLKLLAVALPFLAMSSVFGGYFTAVRKVIKSASAQFIEHIIRIIITVIFLMAWMPRGMEYACVAIVVGSVVGEICSFILLFLLYRHDVKAYTDQGKPTKLVPRMFRIALPIALSAYVTSTIRTLQQLLIPSGLKKSGASGEVALATYGTIQGMVMPILMFPATLLYAIAELIVPELAECQAQNRLNRFNYIITRVLTIGLLSSILIMSVFFRFGNQLGLTIYQSVEAGNFLRILALLVPIMYLDTIVDGVLKGMGQQISSMRYNILESLVGVVLIYYLLPRYAIAGYVFTLFVTRTINFGLSLQRLLRVTLVRISPALILKALFCIVNALIIANLAFHNSRSVPGLAAHIFCVVLVYYTLLRLVNCISDEDLTWFKSIFKKDIGDGS